jgi:hypothetical protein
MLSAGIQPKISQTKHQGIELQTQLPHSSDRSPLTLADRKIIASVLTWDCQRQVSASEIETIAISHDILWVKLTDNRAIPLHVETFKAIRAALLEQAEAVEDAIVVDSDGNQPYPTYRVWKRMAIIGTFCCSPLDSKWLAFPKYGRARHRYTTALEAQAAIVEAWNKAEYVRSTDQGLRPPHAPGWNIQETGGLKLMLAPTAIKSAYSSNPIGRKGAASNWEAFLASGRKLDISGDPMQKWRELERQQQAAHKSTDVPVNCLNSQSQKEAA